MDFNFFMPARIISGKDCLLRQSAQMLPFGKRCGIVTGGSSALTSGALDDMKQALAHEGIDYTVFSGIKPNPATVDCTAAAEDFLRFGVDFIVGIGGGSTLDAAKAVAVLTANPELKNDDIYLPSYRRAPLPTVLVGTSAGTGSEVSAVSVLTNEKGRKKSIKGPSLYASLVYADSAYTASMPYAVTVSTALDALAHAVEGYLSEKCTDIPRLFAWKGIPLIWEGLTFLHENPAVLPDEMMREKLYCGSLYAGIVLNACGTAFPHPMGYILTENYDVPHGAACAVFMPALLERAAEFCPGKICDLEQMTGESITQLSQKVKALSGVRDIVMTDEEITAYCARFADAVPGNFTNTPGGFTYNEAAALLQKLFQGK